MRYILSRPSDLDEIHDRDHAASAILEAQRWRVQDDRGSRSCGWPFSDVERDARGGPRPLRKCLKVDTGGLGAALEGHGLLEDHRDGNMDAAPGSRVTTVEVSGPRSTADSRCRFNGLSVLRPCVSDAEDR